jgi:hypothetical protein
MKCNQGLFDLLKKRFEQCCYDPKAELKWEGNQPVLTLNGEKHPVDRESWFVIAQTSRMMPECIPCISSEPLEVIALKSSDPAEYVLVAINKQGSDGKDYCGYNYSPAIVEALQAGR